ncbi:hypothetical protein ACPPVW_14230 [Leifsonia sp. McL0607]|uniref:hypothetical protein n=1 Tax=Leifsonia sp. McL0607 TaxID=3415672 RepID=UPI003CEB3D0B
MRHDLSSQARPLIARQRAVVATAYVIVTLAAVAALLAAVFLSEADVPVGVKAGVPVFLLLAPGIVLYALIVMPALIGRRLSRAAKDAGMAAYFVGSTPYSNRWLLLGDRYMLSALVRNWSVSLFEI